jgi:general secretion pathway protein D
VLLAATLIGGALPLCADEPSAKDLYKRGRKYEKNKDFANAYLMYAQAAAADPRKSEYWQRAEALRRRAAVAANVLPTTASASTPQPGAAPTADSAPEPIPDAESNEVAEARKPLPPFELEGAPGKKSFDLRADAKALWEQVTKAYGLDIIFDGDYQPGPVITFRLSDVEYREALHALQSATGSFIVPVSKRLMMIVKDSEQKRREVENTVAVAIPIPEPFSVQEAQELGRTVQQVMEIQRFAIDSTQRIVIMRDRVSKVRPAQMLFEQLLYGRAQVALEVELISVAKTSSLRLGLSLPTTFPITSLVKTIALNGGPTSFALGVTGANAFARAAKSEGRTMYQAELHSMDGQPAQLHVGQKYPIMTVAYIGDTSGDEPVYTPPPTFNFEDLGFVLKLTPKVHDRQEVTLEIESEFKLLGAESLNGIPVISNRKFATRARLRFDEAAVIAGLVTDNDFRTLSGPAGLLNIPVLGAALGQYSRTRDDVELLLVIRPRLVTLPASEVVQTREIWLGTESRPRIPL